MLYDVEREKEKANKIINREGKRKNSLMNLFIQSNTNDIFFYNRLNDTNELISEPE